MFSVDQTICGLLIGFFPGPPAPTVIGMSLKIINAKVRHWLNNLERNVFQNLYQSKLKH